MCDSIIEIKFQDAIQIFNLQLMLSNILFSTIRIFHYLNFSNIINPALTNSQTHQPSTPNIQSHINSTSGVVEPEQARMLFWYFFPKYAHFFVKILKNK